MTRTMGRGWADMPSVDLRLGDCLDVLKTLPDGSVDAVVTDPPYGLKFMGKAWDHGVPGVDYWREIGRTLKPGGYLLAFGGTRTFHRQTCAIEDAGLEIRDCLNWLYGSGFPKGKGCLKPAWEPITLARKPGPKVLPLGVDRCRIPLQEIEANQRGNPCRVKADKTRPIYGNESRSFRGPRLQKGRWPANVTHDGSDEVMGAFAEFGEKASNSGQPFNRNTDEHRNAYGAFKGRREEAGYYGDTGSVARFFYAAKASRAEREGSTHPTVKPLNLMRWLVRLVAAPGETVLDPFMGSGTTGKAAVMEGCHFIGCDVNAESVEDSRRRIDAALAAPPLFA